MIFLSRYGRRFDRLLGLDQKGDRQFAIMGSFLEEPWVFGSEPVRFLTMPRFAGYDGLCPTAGRDDPAYTPTIEF